MTTQLRLSFNDGLYIRSRPITEDFYLALAKQENISDMMEQDTENTWTDVLLAASI